MAPINGWFSLEAVYAGKGDSLILHYGARTKPRWMLIDGGHRGVYDGFLRPRLEELRLTHPDRLEQGQLPLTLVMVSHADDDHLLGILDLTANLRSDDPGIPRAPVSIDDLWFNSFSDLIAQDASAEAASVLDGAAQAASFDGSAVLGIPSEIHDDRDVRAVIASTANGRRLRQDAEKLVIDVNEKYGGGLVMRGGAHPSVTRFNPGGLTFTLLGPDKKRIDKLRKRWKKDLEKILAKEAEKRSAADAASFKDQSPFNLSSIMVLAERGGKKMLLTGDARGDDLVKGLEAEGLLDDQGKIHVDLFKLPHHGSDRNAKVETFRDVTARHYLISANGEHDNPDTTTLDMLVEGRDLTRDDDYTVYLTFPEAAFKLIPEELANKKPSVRKQKKALAALDRWIRTKKPANMNIVYREADRPSLSIDFGEKVFGV